MSLLAKAEQTIMQSSESIPARWYPRYHLAPRAGWMNDPNGLIWFKGHYHAFYQHHPYSTKWGPMYWGHARSKDLVNWEHLPIALAPEGAEDKDGCFSGSAVVADDRLALIYTGHKFHGEAGKDENLYQVQCLVTSEDGVHFKREGMVLDTPAGLRHFRDPKVWREGEYWYMVVGAKESELGQVRLYRSADLQQWEDAGVLARAEAGMGFMWECPDFFTLQDRQVLIFSPQGMAANGYDNRNLFQSGYLVGQWQPEQDFQIEHTFRELDHGHDFYAPQSFLTPDGRRILIAWLDMWESPMPEQQDGWAGMFSLPRELNLTSDGRLLMTPAKEIEQLRGQHTPYRLDTLHNQRIQVAEHCTTMEVSLEWRCAESNAEQYGLQLGNGMRLYVDNQAKRIVLERNYPEFGLCGARSVALPEGDILSLRLFFDMSSVEVFINEGEACLSSRIYPADDQRQLTLFANHGSALLHSGGHWVLAE